MHRLHLSDRETQPTINTVHDLSSYKIYLVTLNPNNKAFFFFYYALEMHNIFKTIPTATFLQFFCVLYMFQHNYVAKIATNDRASELLGGGDFDTEAEC